MSTEKRTVPWNSDSGQYLTLVAVHGRCVCGDGWCFNDPSDVGACRLCAALDPEWPCPAEPDADVDGLYPDPDLVKIEGAVS